MIEIITLLGGLLLAQEPAGATIISAADIEATMKASVANHTLDKTIRETPVKGGIVRVIVRFEPSAVK